MSRLHAACPTVTGPALPRRRALLVLAAAAGLPLLARATAGTGHPEPPVYEWEGSALGARSRLVLAHPDPAAVRRVVAPCIAEIERLERIFSLHRPDSELACLNRNGRLRAASHDLRLLLADSRRFAELSDGAFDATVQPLWRLYADHFARRPGASDGPDARALDAARRLVDHRAIETDGAAVAFGRPGMAATLNGIAQGRITDRVADLLRDAGFERVLVQLGETRALAPPPGRPSWRVAVPDPARPDSYLATFELTDCAVATSAGQATPFDRLGRHHHLLDPRTGQSAHRYATVAVVAARATAADALSTALSILPATEAARLLRAAGGETALYLYPDGRRQTVTAHAAVPAPSKA